MTYTCAGHKVLEVGFIDLRAWEIRITKKKSVKESEREDV